MGMPSMPAIQQPTAAPAQNDTQTAAEIEAAEKQRKRQIANMQGRMSTIGSSMLGDTGEVEGYKVSLLGGR